MKILNLCNQNLLTLPKGHKKTVCLGLQRLQQSLVCQYVILKCPAPSTDFRFVSLTCFPWTQPAVRQVGMGFTVTSQTPKLSRRENQRDGALEILTLSQAEVFSQQRISIGFTAQNPSRTIPCAFGYKQLAYSLLLKHSWKKWFATKILSFKCK